MPRQLDSSLSTALASGLIQPIIMVMLTFKSQTIYVWNGVGTLIYGGNNYLGVGSLGKIGDLTEGITVQAHGTAVQLSGIDPLILGESMTDIQIGAPAKIWIGVGVNGSLVGAPALAFSGAVDKYSLSAGGDTVSISLSLVNKMVEVARPSNRRYTAADQRRLYPTDTAFDQVERLNDIAVRWGS